LKERKKRAREKWMLIGEDLSLHLAHGEYRSDDDLLKMAGGQLTEESSRMMRKQAAALFQAEFSQPHNSINRLTQTTGKGAFAPFSGTTSFYYPEVELALFVLLEEEATDIDRVTDALAAIGLFGFGRDASTGGGRFSLAEWEEKTIPAADGADACYILAPAIPEKTDFSDYYFTPFVRFGKHGDRLARSANPFRNPVIMADEGAVFIPKTRAVFEKPYLGRPAFNTSKVMEQTVVQGYAPYLPFRLER
jgi:CRISPR-associated protein Csm4